MFEDGRGGMFFFFVWKNQNREYRADNLSSEDM